MRIFEIVGQAARLSPLLRRKGVPPVYAVVATPLGRRASGSASTERGGYKSFLLCLCFFLSSCASPRVLEVSSWTRLKDIDAADERIFVHDQASRIPYRPHELPADQQREEFYVHWRGANVDRVKFEYRQVDVPNTVKEQSILLGSAGVEAAVPNGTGPGRGGDAGVESAVPSPARSGASRKSDNPPPDALGTAHATTGSPPTEGPGVGNRESAEGGQAVELGTSSHVFAIRGEDFHNGGPVSAWHVSLWSGDQLLAERKSALW